MHIFKFWLSEFLIIHKDFIYEYMRFFVLLKDGPVVIDFSIFQIIGSAFTYCIPFFTFNYSVDIYFEIFDVSKSVFFRYT